MEDILKIENLCTNMLSTIIKSCRNRNCMEWLAFERWLSET